jgi:hypothetical protein
MNKVIRFVDNIPPMKIYHFVVFIFFLSSLYAGTLYKLPIVILALVNLAVTHEKLEKWSAIFYSLNFLGLAYSNYYIMANHFFLLGLFSLFIVYRLWVKDRQWNYSFYILTMVITVATLQKVGSLYFLEGNLMAQFLMNGKGLSLIGHFFDPDYTTNSFNFYNNYGYLPYTHKAAAIVTTDSLAAFAKAFTYIIVISEILLTLALIFLKPQWKYWALFIFLIATSLTRNEYGFFSILITISIFDTTIQNTRIQRYYKYVLPVFVIGFFYTHSLRLMYYLEHQL